MICIVLESIKITLKISGNSEVSLTLRDLLSIRLNQRHIPTYSFRKAFILERKWKKSLRLHLPLVSLGVIRDFLKHFLIKIPLKQYYVPLESHYVLFTLGPNKLLNIKSDWDLLLNSMKGKTDVFFMIVSGFIGKMYFEVKHFS